MKILVLFTDVFDLVGGMGVFNRTFVKAIGEITSNKNFKVEVLSLVDKGNSSLVNKYITSSNVLYSGFGGNRLFFIIRALVSSLKADKVIFGHINFSFLGFLMNLFKRKQERYLVVHGVEAWCKFSLLKKIGLNYIQNILSVSKYTRDEMIKHNKIKDSKFHIFLNTLDPLYIETVQKNNLNSLSLPSGKMILCVSRLEKDSYKNVDLLIKAMPEVLKNIQDAFCVIVGTGSGRKRLEDLSKSLNLEKKVFFTGKADLKSLPLYLKKNDVFVLPSTGEGFGIVFLEAMYFEKPCIGARSGGVPEVIEDGRTGYLVEPNDINDLSSKIIKLLSDKELSQQMGKEGKVRLEEKFSFEAFKERLRGIILQ